MNNMIKRNKIILNYLYAFRKLLLDGATVNVDEDGTILITPNKLRKAKS